MVRWLLSWSADTADSVMLSLVKNSVWHNTIEVMIREHTVFFGLGHASVPVRTIAVPAYFGACYPQKLNSTWEPDLLSYLMSIKSVCIPQTHSPLDLLLLTSSLPASICWTFLCQLCCQQPALSTLLSAASVCWTFFCQTCCRTSVGLSFVDLLDFLLSVDSAYSP